MSSSLLEAIGQVARDILHNCQAAEERSARLLLLEKVVKGSLLGLLLLPLLTCLCDSSFQAGSSFIQRAGWPSLSSFLILRETVRFILPTRNTNLSLCDLNYLIKIHITF
jgi:hypothetical protein